MTKFQICINVDDELSEVNQAAFVARRLEELSKDLRQWRALLVNGKLRHDGKVVGQCWVEDEEEKRQ